jgi:hypothetical protein
MPLSEKDKNNAAYKSYKDDITVTVFDGVLNAD